MKKNNSTVEKIRVDLDINEHIKIQEKGWQVQAVGIYFIFAFVLSAALGLYGDGITSKRNLIKNKAAVEYDRFFRAGAKMDLKIKATSAQNVTVSFPARYLNNFEITSIVPQPGESRFEGDHVQYVFNGRDGMEITFYLVPQKMGQVEGSIKINDNLFTINHFIFP